MNRNSPHPPVTATLTTIRVAIWVRGPVHPLVVWLRVSGQWQRSDPDFGTTMTVAGLRMELADSLPTHDRAYGVWLKSAAERSAWLERLFAEQIEFTVEEAGE
jgi:hypothetical protein